MTEKREKVAANISAEISSALVAQGRAPKGPGLFITPNSELSGIISDLENDTEGASSRLSEFAIMLSKDDRRTIISELAGSGGDGLTEVGELVFYALVMVEVYDKLKEQ